MNNINMNTENNDKQNPWGITREEVLELAATKIAEQYGDDYDSVETRVERGINDHLQKALRIKLDDNLERILNDVTAKLLSEQVIPVDIWGERKGEPTTIRDALAKRAQGFWEEKVDKDGKKSDYSGKPRHQWIFEKVVGEEFTKSIKDNVESITKGFKEALRADAGQQLGNYIEKLIPSQRR